MSNCTRVVLGNIKCIRCQRSWRALKVYSQDLTEVAGAPRGSALPRSMMTVLLRSPSSARPMFSGLTSRWAYPAACIASSPRRMHKPTTLHSISESSPPRAVRASRSVPPLINLPCRMQADAAGGHVAFLSKCSHV